MSSATERLQRDLAQFAQRGSDAGLCNTLQEVLKLLEEAERAAHEQTIIIEQLVVAINDLRSREKAMKTAIMCSKLTAAALEARNMTAALEKVMSERGWVYVAYRASGNLTRALEALRDELVLHDEDKPQCDEG